MQNQEIEKLTREELIQRISDPDEDFSTLKEYLTLKKDAKHGLRVDADNENLIIDESQDNPLTEANVAFDWVVKAIRLRRRKQFKRSLKKRPENTIVLLDGDSWAQNPLVEEIYDKLTAIYNVSCSSLAGRTMQELHDENCYIEMYQDLQDEGHEQKIRAIVLSGGGNDLFGKKLNKIIKQFDTNHAHDPTAHIDTTVFDQLIDEIVNMYSEVVRKFRVVNRTIPIILHTYSYLTPWNVNNGVLPKDAWVGDPMREKGINDLTLQKAIVRKMVDVFHTQLKAMVDSTPSAGKIVLLDNRELLPGKRDLWSDEIHPSSKGFKLVGDRILSAIELQ